MKHIESAQQAQVVEWSRWAYKTDKDAKNLVINAAISAMNGI